MQHLQPVHDRHPIHALFEQLQQQSEYALTVLPLPDPLFDLDRIVTYTGSVRGAWGSYVIVSMEHDTYTLTPLRRAELPNVHWLREVRESSITPQIDANGEPLVWTDEYVTVDDDDAERIRWWIRYYRPQVMHECLDCGLPAH